MTFTCKAYHRKTSAFSLAEIAITVVAIGLLASIGIAGIGNMVSASRFQKLESDTVTINSAVQTYIASGGTVDDVTSVNDLIVKLKTRTDNSMSARIPGLSSSMIDPRVTTVMQSASEAAATDARAVWDPVARRLKIERSGGVGVKEFQLDENLAEASAATGDRASAMKYAGQSTWIWDYQDVGLPAAPKGPDSFAVTPDVALSAPPAIPPPVAPAGKFTLDPPVPSLPGGSYVLSGFNLTVSLSNPNPSGVSDIYYAVNYGNWTRYTAPLSIAPGTILSAQAIPIDPLWEPSGKVDEKYAAISQNLDPPQIAMSSSQFSPTVSTITVTLNNPNPAGTSSLIYAIKQPTGTYPDLASFLPYTGPFPANVAAFPDGFHIRAYAKSLDPINYPDSEPAEALTTADFFGTGLGGDILFVIDASGSMNALFSTFNRFDWVVGETIAAINSLAPTQKFTVITFSSGLHWAFGGADLKEATAENKLAAVSGLAALSAYGGTNYEVGLSYALSLPTKPTQVIFLSDGQPNQRNYLDELNALAAQGIKVNTIGIGNAASQAPLQEVANISGGSFRFVADPGSAGTLAAPRFSTGGNEFDHTKFPFPLILSNPNAVSTSRIRYSINGGPVSTYTGPLSLSYDSTVVAFVDSTDPSWAKSAEVTETYAVKSFTAAQPEISLSAGDFTDSTPNITVTLNDKNEAGLSSLVWWFSSAAETTAVPYTGPFTLSAANWDIYAGNTIQDIKIYVRAVGSHGFVLNSSTSDVAIQNKTTVFVTNLSKPALKTPVFSPIGGDFDFSKFPLTVSLSNPNSSVGQIEVSVNGGTLVPYTGPISVGYNTIVTTYVNAVGPKSGLYKSSPMLSQIYKPRSVTLSTPTMSLSANTFTSTVKTITVTLTNPNPATISRLVYWWEGDDPATATTYTGPITLSAANWEFYQTPGKSDAKLYVRAEGTQAFVKPSTSINKIIKNTN